MARPKKSEPRSAQFNVSVTPSELESIKRRAAAVGMRPVHFGRARLLDTTGTAPAKVQQATNHDRMIYGQLVRLGNNLNQMLRRLHGTDDPPPADLEPLLNDIRQIISRYRDDRPNPLKR
jgi:hypothetical protein